MDIPQVSIFPNYLQQTEDCSVCLDKLSTEIAIEKIPEERNVQKFLLIKKNDMTPLRTECNQFIHYGCFKKWVAKQGEKTKCPLCNYDFKFINDSTVPEVINDQEVWNEIAERYGYEEEPIDNRQVITIRSFFERNITGMKNSCFAFGKTIVGKIIWKNFQIKIMDVTAWMDVKTVAIQRAKYSGWCAVAYAVGSLFGTFLPCLICRKPDPELGNAMGNLLGLTSLGVQIYSLGPLSVLKLEGYHIFGYIVFFIAKKVAQLAISIQRKYC